MVISNWFVVVVLLVGWLVLCVVFWFLRFLFFWFFVFCLFHLLLYHYYYALSLRVLATLAQVLTQFFLPT